MFGYMTDLETVEIDPALEVEVEVEGLNPKWPRSTSLLII